MSEQRLYYVRWFIREKLMFVATYEPMKWFDQARHTPEAKDVRWGKLEPDQPKDLAFESDWQDAYKPEATQTEPA